MTCTSAVLAGEFNAHLNSCVLVHEVNRCCSVNIEVFYIHFGVKVG
jgi:hypothetical protein